MVKQRLAYLVYTILVSCLNTFVKLDYVFLNQDLPAYSFDYSAHQAPIAYYSYGGTVELLTKTILIPAVERITGAYILSKQLQTSQFEIDIEFVLKSELSESDGFSIKLSPDEPSFPEVIGPLNGMKRQFRGVGVYLYKSQTKSPNKWYVILLQNKGHNQFNSLEDSILAHSSCPIEISKDMRGGIRIRLDNAGYEIDIRQANGDVEYMYCVKQQNFETFKPYLSILAFNNGSKNEIELQGIYVKNRDPKAYTDKEQLDNERLVMLIRKTNNGEIDEKNIHPHDLLSAKIRTEYASKILTSGTMLDVVKDDQFEILFKYYETLVKFQTNLDELYQKLTSYQEDQQYAEKILMRNDQTRAVDDELQRLENKSKDLGNGMAMIKDIITKLRENTAIKDMLKQDYPKEQEVVKLAQEKREDDIKINPKIMMLIRQIDQQVDALTEQIKKATLLYQNFDQEFPEIYLKDTEKQKQKRIEKEQNKRIPQDILQLMTLGASQMKESVDKDYETGFPLISFMILIGILGMLFQIYQKINQKMVGSTKGTKSHVY
eukprot:403331610